MAQLYKAPNRPIDGGRERRLRVFLAGSIEMGTCEDWQQKVFDSIKDFDVDVFNPRRDEWDSSWEQDISNPHFYEQVKWELEYIDKADIVVVYFDPATKSPVTMLELGIICERKLFLGFKEVIVCCPVGFWRRGNVQIVCEKYGIELLDDLDDLKPKLLELTKAFEDLLPPIGKNTPRSPGYYPK